LLSLRQPWANYDQREGCVALGGLTTTLCGGAAWTPRCYKKNQTWMFDFFYSLHNFATQNCASSPFEASMKAFFRCAAPKKRQPY
jgi:hypothetical protein